ncbi:MAG: hypothetical protein Q9171_005852 [Xanthocarpia ochracea]
MSSGPPKHEMQYFPNMTSALPSESAEFRRVLWTGLYSQVVLMTVPVGGDIGDEVHTVDQALTFTSGVGKATINGKDQDVKAGDLMVVPAGTQHQFVNTGPTPLILYTIYSPAEHNPQTVHKTKEEGDEEEENGKDEAPDWSRKSKAENEKAGLVFRCHLALTVSQAVRVFNVSRQNQVKQSERMWEGREEDEALACQLVTRREGIGFTYDRQTVTKRDSSLI